MFIVSTTKSCEKKEIEQGRILETIHNSMDFYNIINGLKKIISYQFNYDKPHASAFSKFVRASYC